jgi:hypothetical protein
MAGRGERRGISRSKKVLDKVPRSPESSLSDTLKGLVAAADDVVLGARCWVLGAGCWAGYIRCANIVEAESTLGPEQE